MRVPQAEPQVNVQILKNVKRLTSRGGHQHSSRSKSGSGAQQFFNPQSLSIETIYNEHEIGEDGYIIEEYLDSE